MKQGQKRLINKLINDNSGQAAVEYILLAVIVVSLIIGAGKLFKSLDDGFNQYMGGYISCLMEYGELPSLGVKEADLKKHTGSTGKKCDAQFAAFTFEEGRPPAGSSSGGGGTNGNNSAGSSNGRNGNNNNGSNNNAGNGNGSGNGDGSGSGNGDDGDSDTAGGSLNTAGGRGGGSQGSRAGRRGGATGSAVAVADDPSGYDDNKTRVIDEDIDEADAEKSRSRRRRNLSNTGNYESYRAITGRMKQELEKQEKRRASIRQPTRTVTAVTKEEQRFLPTKRALPERNVAVEAKEMNDSGNNFSFGNIIRWLLIAAMVLAIIIFFGGQVLNYNNSKD